MSDLQVRTATGREGVIEVTTLAGCLRRAATRFDHEALVFPDERVTFPQLVQRVEAHARALVALGVEPGDAVGILLHQGVDHLALLLATTQVGGVAVPINARYKARELRHVVRQSRMRVLVLSAVGAEVVDHLALLEDALPELRTAVGDVLALADAPALRRVVRYGQGSPHRALTAWEAYLRGGEAVDPAEVEERHLAVSVGDPAVVMYTSGTTSDPKGALLTHEGLVREGLMVARTRFHLTAADRLWTALPLYHIGGVAFAFAAWSAGTTYVHTGAFDPGAAVAQLRDERCTVAIGVFDTIWLAVIDHPDFDAGAVPDLRLLFMVGVPERLRALQHRLPDVTLVSGFGSTEASSFLCLGDPDDDEEARVTTCGRPMPGMQVRIVDPDTGVVVGAGAFGEIQYRGWGLFRGYLGDPEQTAAAIDPAGWFRSGDAGHLDPAGRLVFRTRLKDMLKVGGENVAAAEVEGHLITHPAVLVAQVVGAPDARYGEVPAAFLQLKPGHAVDAEEIIDFCLGRIATFKVPRHVRVVREWPMSGTKVQKHILRDRIAAELHAAGVDQAPKLRAAGPVPPPATARSGRP